MWSIAMRRIFLSTGLILAATLAPLSAGYAQLTFGGFAGVNFSNLDISALDPNESTSSRTGGMLGGYLGTHLGRLFTVRLEGFWTRKGADLQESSSSVGSFKIDYIEIPLILRVNLPLVVIKPAIYAGPAISFKTNCTAEDSTLSESCEDVGVMIKSTDFSGIIGAGIGFGPITLDVQYDRSFSSILDEDGASEVKNETWTVRAAFGI
jgi:hypothetical protein